MLDKPAGLLVGFADEVVNVHNDGPFHGGLPTCAGGRKSGFGSHRSHRHTGEFSLSYIPAPRLTRMRSLNLITDFLYNLPKAFCRVSRRGALFPPLFPCNPRGMLFFGWRVLLHDRPPLPNKKSPEHIVFRAFSVFTSGFVPGAWSGRSVPPGELPCPDFSAHRLQCAWHSHRHGGFVPAPVPALRCPRCPASYRPARGR